MSDPAGELRPINSGAGGRKIRLSTLIVMASTGLSRVLGFVRIAIVSAVFGGHGPVDAYNMVFIIPNNLRNLLAEGALSSAFIPVLSTTLVEDKSLVRARKLVNSLMSFQFVLIIPFLILCVIFAEPIVSLILPFPDPEQHKLAVTLFALMIHYILLVSISAVMMAILNCHGQFAIPALAPLMFSITTIVSIFLFTGTLNIFSMVVGVLSGGIFQILVMLPSYYRTGYRIGLDLSFRKNEDFRKVLRLWGPVVGTAAIFSLNEQIAVFFATGLGPGNGTAMTNALIFWQLPIGIFYASITTVLFPRLSRQMAEKKPKEAKDTILYGLRMLIYLLVPSAFLLIVWGREIIAVGLQRGAYTVEDTELAYQALWAYSLGLVTVGTSRFLQRFFYARHDFKVPLISALVMVLVDLGFTIIFIVAGCGIASLGYANTVSSVAGFILLFVSVRKALGGMQTWSLAASLGKALLSCLPMIILALVLDHYMGDWWKSGGTWHNFGILCVLGILAVASILAMYIVLRVEALGFFRGRKRG